MRLPLSARAHPKPRSAHLRPRTGRVPVRPEPLSRGRIPGLQEAGLLRILCPGKDEMPLSTYIRPVTPLPAIKEALFLQKSVA